MKYLLFIFLLTGCSFVIVAQTSTTIKVAKFKPPAVTSYLGVNTNGASVTKEEASELIVLPLKIKDAKENLYPISSYQFLYKRKSVVEDEETGKKEITFTTVAGRFTATPLPAIWIDNIKDGFQPGEELYFFDIVVKDSKGRDFFAPALKITIQ